MQSKTYCKHPFREIAIKEYRGNELKAFWPCCMMGNDFPTLEQANVLKVKDPHTLTPQEMYDHPRMQLLRDNLSNDIRDPACKTCWSQEDRGLQSFRHYSNENFGYEEDGLSVIDITASNICNLRCRMCSPTASHQLMQDHQYFKKNNLLSKVERVTNRWVESIAIEATKSIQWDWLIENTDKIKVLKASGGEPFYDNKVIQLLQHYVKTGSAKNTMLIFHTNATQFNEENVAMLNQFKRNKHTFSIDGVGKTYEYIRYPAVFSETEESVKRYIKDVKNYDPILNFVFVVSAHNILNVDDFLTWSKQLYPGVCCQFSEVYSRDRGISIQHLSIDILTEAKKQAQNHLIRSNGLEDGDVANLIRMIDDAINNNKENKQIVKDECELFDMSRNQSYRDFLHPMMVEWLDNA
jgi:sulfatase maturation enzyme AslB (radical SAM superfamily)